MNLENLQNMNLENLLYMNLVNLQYMNLENLQYMNLENLQYMNLENLQYMNLENLQYMNLESLQYEGGGEAFLISRAFLISIMQIPIYSSPHLPPYLNCVIQGGVDMDRCILHCMLQQLHSYSSGI